jgi:hypothetical protein
VVYVVEAGNMFDITPHFMEYDIGVVVGDQLRIFIKVEITVDSSSPGHVCMA